MHDPLEGLTALGTISTGASRARISAAFESLLDAAVSALDPGTSLYVYGSVATGMAEPPASDVDLLSVGLTQRKLRISRVSCPRSSLVCVGQWR